MRLYVGNLTREVNEDDLKEVFQPFGTLSEVSIVRDKLHKTSKGFAFVEMPSEKEAKQAIEDLSGKELKGRNLTVNEARPRTERSTRRDGYNAR